MKVVHDADGLETRLAALLTAARRLEVPVIVTEQYRKGLGSTSERLRLAAGEVEAVEKMTFSCFGEPAFVERVEALDRGTVVVAGIEAHVCVMQTALDALALGYQVQIPADGIGSRSDANRLLALSRLDRAGAVATCIESLLFEWLERCDDPAFKDVQGLIK